MSGERCETSLRAAGRGDVGLLVSDDGHVMQSITKGDTSKPNPSVAMW